MRDINKAMFARMPAFPVRRKGVDLPDVKLNVVEQPTQDFSTGTATPNRFDGSIYAWCAASADIAIGDQIKIDGARLEVLEIHRSTTHESPNIGLLLIILAVNFTGSSYD